MSKSGSDSKNTLYCSFCGKSQHEVRKLIAGPTVFICDECVELCMDIIREENKTSLVKSRDGVPIMPIESSRFQAVPDPEAYSGHAIFRSGVAVFPPSAFATGARFRLDVRDSSRQGKTITIDIPSRSVDRIRADLAGFLER